MGSVRLFQNVTSYLTITEGATYNLALEFYVTKTAWLTHICFFSPSALGTLDTRGLSLWRVDGGSAGARLITRFNKVPDGFDRWTSGALAVPYQLIPNQRYRADYRITHSPPDPFMGYVASAGFFTPAADHVNDYLIAPSAQNTTGTDQNSFTEGLDVFPDGAFNNTHYGVDVIVTDVDPTGPPTGSAAFGHSWSVGATGVAPTLTIPTGSANFSHIWNVQAGGQAVPVPMAIGSANFRHIWDLLAGGETPVIDIPSGAATFTHRWTVTAKSQSVGVTDLMPEGTPIKMGLGSFARGVIQAQAESLMDSVIKISRPGKAYDPVSRRDSNTAGTLLYEGPARIWEVPGGSTTIIGDDEIVMTSTYMSVPYSTPIPEVDDLIVIVESIDPDLVGRTVSIDSIVRGGTLAASRQFSVTLSTSQKGTW